MSLLARMAILVVVVLALLVPAGIPASAKTYPVPPPGPKQNTATLNILDGINAIRKKGFRREADQLQKLLNEGRVFYRTTGKNRLDAQFVHGVLPGEKDTLFFGVQHVKFIKGKGIQRFKKGDDDRRLALLVLIAMHEMIHKDQSPASIVSSDIRAGARGYTLHEIEAYRASMKKYARKWIVGDINDFLKNQGAMDDRQKEAALDRLRAQLWALDNALGSPGKHGDRACRWKAIQKEVKKLRDDLDALWLGLGSQRSCRYILASVGQHKQAVIEANLRLSALRKKLQARRRTIRTLVRSIPADNKRRASLRRQLKRSPLQSHRIKLAARITEYDLSSKRDEKRLADARRERAALRAERKSTRIARTRAQGIYLGAGTKYDRCRIDYIKTRMKRYKLSASQLPLDMVKTKSGRLIIVSAKKKRKIDIKKALDAIKDMFNYDTKLVGAVVSKDPRTPCYKPPKAKKKKKKKVASGKPAARPKKKCRRGGLVGAMNCVTKRIERGH